ncbi:hypothetical protein MRX96_006010 [Rhipicephalus microplus]
MEKTPKDLRICLFALQFAVVGAGASVLGLPDDFPPMGGICEAAPAMDPRLLETTCVKLSERVERPLEYHRCAAATTTSSSSETILPSIQQYLFCGHGGTMEETTKCLRICLFALQFAVVTAGASVLCLPDDFPPIGGICEAAPAMNTRLLERTCVILSERMERPLEYHRCAAAMTTSSSSETILPSIQHIHTPSRRYYCLYGAGKLVEDEHKQESIPEKW